MKSLALPVFLTMQLFTATLAFTADEKFDPAARAKAVAPFIDEETYAVIHVDLTRVKVDIMVDEITRLMPSVFGGEDIAKVKSGAQKGLDPLLKGGVKEIFGVVRSHDLDIPSLLIIPLTPDADEKSILAALPPNVPSKRIDNVLLLLPAYRSRKLSDIQTDSRLELAAAFEAAGDTAVQVIYTPPKHFRRVIEETMPQLPKEVGGGDGKILTQGCLWAALGLDLPPQMSIKLVIQSQDAAAATALRAKWIDTLKFAAQMPKAKELFPNLNDVAESLTPKVEDDRLVLSLDDREGKISKIITDAQPAMDVQRENTQRMQSMMNLRQIAISMMNYLNANKSFPAAAHYSKEGKPLLSWRVMLLPYMDHKSLYNQFHLDEPWDSPNNIKLIDKMPEIYRSPKSTAKEPGRTNYVVLVGSGTVFEGKEGLKPKDIKDGLSNTIMAVEVDDDHAVIWTKPDDLAYDPKEPAKGLGGHFKDVFLFVACDGTVHDFPLSISANDLRAWFTAAGGDKAKTP